MKKYALIMSLAIFTLTLPACVLAGGFPDSVPGTYLVTESSGNKRLWTFTADGNILGTSSAQKKFDFGNQQGVWEVKGKQEVSAVIFNFGFSKDGSLAYTGRVSVTLKFDEKCQKVEGSLVLRKFEPPENPMKPGTDAGTPITDTFKGQRITVK